jgi:CRP/FNR family transcriptional regulator, anaerobic regulatory protein
MEELLHLLNSTYLMTSGLQAHLYSILKVRELQKKDFLLKAGQVSNTVHFIHQGLLRCFYVKGDHEVSSWFMKEGDVIFSIESFYDQVPSYESIQALEDCLLYYITFDELEYIYNTYAEFNYIGRVLTIKYHKLWARQLYSIRMRSAEERFEWLFDNHPELLLRVPAKHLASYLDITEVTLSKIKSKKAIS